MQRRTMLLSAAVMAALGSASPLALAADQTMNVDVCIVGAGAGGVSAGMASVDAGFKTVILEKLGVIGGGGNYMEGTFAVGSRLQLKDNVGINVEKQFKRVMDFHHWRINGKALNNWLKQTAATIDWMEQHGIKFEGVHTAFIDGNRTWHMFEGGHGSSLIKNFAQKIEAKGGQILTSTPAQSLIIDKNGTVTGVIAKNEDGDKITINAKAVIIATGGAGRMHYQGFPTSNHYGATADGLVLGYRAGAKLLYADTLQYHPTGAAYPEQIFGALVTEKVRSLGAKLVNVDGEVFMNPLETRDVTASTVIRECRRGKQVNTPTGGQGVWLDSPMIDLIHGEGTIEKRIPAMLRMFLKYGIDIRKQPMLIYPTLHYQNGGVKVGTDSQTCVENLFVAGEAAGGVHGENRLMGNSLLDVIVFGRNAGKYAAAKAKTVEVGNLTLDHVAKFEKELADAGIQPDEVSPKLLPDYTRKVNN